jgi:ATP-dependent exoDNAse (exonuclease V) beta subunit
MAIGTLTHRYLEAIANDGLTAWPSQRITELLPAFEQYFANEGHEPVDCGDAATLVQEALLGALNSEHGQWLLGPREAAGCEVPMSSLHADLPESFSHHVIDRTFIDAGDRWIIDYKTMRIAESDTPIEQQLRAKAEAYKPQLQRYAALFAKEGLNIRTAIFFPTHGTLIEV